LPLRLPVRYRARGERRWHHGTTASISVSGAVIVGEAPSAPAQLVVAISLPASDGCLTARATLIRRTSSRRRLRSAAFVVAVRRFRVEKRAAAFTRFDARR